MLRLWGGSWRVHIRIAYACTSSWSIAHTWASVRARVAPARVAARRRAPAPARSAPRRRSAARAPPPAQRARRRTSARARPRPCARARCAGPRRCARECVARELVCWRTQRRSAVTMHAPGVEGWSNKQRFMLLRACSGNGEASYATFSATPPRYPLPFAATRRRSAGARARASMCAMEESDQEEELARQNMLDRSVFGSTRQQGSAHTASACRSFSRVSASRDSRGGQIAWVRARAR
eukprot:4556298-Pleurochrysis_carterae.AAC.1